MASPIPSNPYSAIPPSQRMYIAEGLALKKASLRRAINATSNPAIREILETDSTNVDAIAAQLAISSQPTQ